MTKKQEEMYKDILIKDHFYEDFNTCAENPDECVGVTHHTVTREQFKQAVAMSQ